jgi:hypothetical protein
MPSTSQSARAPDPVRPDDQRRGPAVPVRGQPFGQVEDQRLLARPVADRPHRGAGLLRRPRRDAERGADIARPEPEGRDPAAVRIDEVFEVVKRAAPGAEPAEQRHAVRLPLEGVAEEDVPVPERRILRRQLLQPEDDGVHRGLSPRARRGDLRARVPVLGGRDDPRGTVLDRHAQAGVDQGAHTLGRHADAALVGALLRPNPQMRHLRQYPRPNACRISGSAVAATIPTAAPTPSRMNGDPRAGAAIERMPQIAA